MHCIDTPSFNGQLHDPVRVKELGELLTKVAAGVDAFLFVVKCTRYRYAEGLMRTHTQEKKKLFGFESKQAASRRERRLLYCCNCSHLALTLSCPMTRFANNEIDMTAHSSRRYRHSKDC